MVGAEGYNDDDDDDEEEDEDEAATTLDLSISSRLIIVDFIIFYSFLCKKDEYIHIWLYDCQFTF